MAAEAEGKARAAIQLPPLGAAANLPASDGPCPRLIVATQQALIALDDRPQNPAYNNACPPEAHRLPKGLHPHPPGQVLRF